MLEGRIQFDLRAVHGTQDYEAWAVTLLNKSKLIDHDVARQRFMEYARHLRVSTSSKKYFSDAFSDEWIDGNMLLE